MNSDEKVITKNDKFFFERKDTDIPFYNNNPSLTKVRWFMLAMVVLSFAFLIFGTQLLPESFEVTYPFLMFIIPVLFFGLASKWKFGLIIKMFKKIDFVLIVAFSIILWLYALVCRHFLGMSSQSSSFIQSFQMSINAFQWIQIQQVVNQIFQLFGEELFRITLFIILLFVLYKYMDNRKISIVISVLISSLVFGVFHILGHNLLDIIIIQGLGSIFLTFLYLTTNNILVSYITHLIYNLITMFAIS